MTQPRDATVPDIPVSPEENEGDRDFDATESEVRLEEEVHEDVDTQVREDEPTLVERDDLDDGAPSSLEKTEPEPKTCQRDADAERAGTATVAHLQEVLAPVTSLIADLSEQVRSLQVSFKERFLYDEAKEIVLDRMHRELQDYKQGVIERLEKPLLLELVSVYLELREAAAVREAQGATQAAGDLAYYTEVVEQALANHDCYPYETQALDPYNGLTHQIKRTAKTVGADQDRRIHESLRPGIMYGERPLLREWVSVFKYSPEAGAEKGESA